MTEHPPPYPEITEGERLKVAMPPVEAELDSWQAHTERGEALGWIDAARLIAEVRTLRWRLGVEERRGEALEHAWGDDKRHAEHVLCGVEERLEWAEEAVGDYFAAWENQVTHSVELAEQLADARREVADLRFERDGADDGGAVQADR